MSRAIPAIVAVAALFSASTKLSDAGEQLQLLATGAEWVALAHSESMIAAPDVRVVGNNVSRVSSRAANESMEFRTDNPRWSLPSNVKGVITVTVGDWTTTLDIGANTDDIIAALISDEIARTIFAATDKAAGMSVTIGKANAFQVSLKGSTRATNAFRTCAGINANSKALGSNPFN